MSKNNITLSKKYGLNPTIPVCFFCGEEKNEIALLGHIGDCRKGEDFKAPHRVILDYEPCDKCKEAWSKGVTIIEVAHRDLGRPEIAPNAQPTGRVVICNPEAFNGEHKAGEKFLMIEDEFSQMFSEVL